MLRVVIPAKEQYDEVQNLFFKTKECTLQLEHSLIALSKWESKWKKPFLDQGQKSVEEILDYIKCMTITPNVDPNIYKILPVSVLEQIEHYIDDTMTATTFYETKTGARSTNKITSELIYYWMVAFNIPFECQKWHLNRLLTLIRICSTEQERATQPKKNRSRADILNRNRMLNEQRRRAMNSKG